MKRKVLILTYNGYHQLIAQSIFQLEEIRKDSVIIDHHLLSNSNLKEYENYISLSKNKFVKFFQVAKWRFFIKKFIRENEIEEVIIPHSEGVISNLLYSSLKKAYKISFYHEGILSFYNFKRGKKKWFRFRKDIIPYLFFYRFKRFDNLFEINNESVFKFYTPIVSNNLTIKDHSKIVEIKLKNFQFSGNKKFDALILGTPFEKSDGVNLEEVFQRIKIILENNDVYKVVYKPHPVENYSLLGNLFLKDFETTFLERSIPIEDYVGDILPRIVIAFNSSALISLKLSNQEKDFYCLFQKKQLNEELHYYFLSLGIICLVE